MKNMKRVISTLLMLSMMAALLCVPAFADETQVDNVYITAPSSTGSYTIPENYSGNVSFKARVEGASLSDPSGLTVVWALNGSQFPATTDEYGVSSVAYTLDEFVDGNNNIVTATINEKTAQCSVYKPVPSLGANDELLLDDNTISVTYGDTTKSIKASVNGVQDNSLVDFYVYDTSVIDVSEWGDIITNGLGTTTVSVSIKNNPSVKTTCTVQVVSSVPDPSNVPTTVSINPVPTTLQKGQTIDIFAAVEGTAQTAIFDHWHLDSKDAAYVSLGYDKAQGTTLTARAATKSPVTLYAFAKDGTSTYVQFTIAANENLQLQAPADMKNGETATVFVTNAFVGEEFTWNIVSSAQYGVLTASNKLGSAVELTAGPVEGRITVTATSSNDTTRTATATILVNSEAAYGAAKINPVVTTWQKGQGALKFEVSPAYFKSYMDGKLLTANSGYYTYYNGILTINPSLLSTLSSGEHTLKVYTSNGTGIGGLVYATIYVTGSASNVYGDNAHVRGSGYNLYFNSTDPIKEVYISNQWIDPANYTLTNNGTGLTLKSDFLNKLGYGSYSMKLVTQNGYNQNASFRIVTANYAPATGDDANMGAWMALLMLSVAGAVALIPRRKKSTDLVG